MLMDTPTIRLVARRLLPSTRAERICVRFLVGNLFVLNMMLDCKGTVKAGCCVLVVSH